MEKCKVKITEWIGRLVSGQFCRCNYIQSGQAVVGSLAAQSFVDAIVLNMCNGGSNVQIQ